MSAHPTTDHLIDLSADQQAIVDLPIERRVFLEGPAGTGKTTAGVHRLLRLLDSGVPGSAVLVVVPQRTLAAPYLRAVRVARSHAGGQVTILTIGGLAQRTVDLFWPLVAEEAGFGNPEQPPTFLTLETAQYYMARLTRPLLEQGYFETITIDRNRLYSQIIDNLNKAAVVGFPHTEIGDRLKEAWAGEASQRRIYDEAQICATRFREYCLAHNLLDFSLQIEVFVEHLWPMGLCRNYLLDTYTHLIVDNVEEDTPVAHEMVADWLPHSRSALVVFDRQAGYRRFLGADPASAHELGSLCDRRITFTRSYVTSPDLRALAAQLAAGLGRQPEPADRSSPDRRIRGDPLEAMLFEYHRYYPQMLDWVTDEVAALIHDWGVPPGEIVVLAPFLPDVLRFSLANRLASRDVPYRSHRPSRALREEPATGCLLTLAAIAHPAWGRCPTTFDVAHALALAIDGLDPVRAQMLTRIVYRPTDGQPVLTSFDQIGPDMQERLTYLLGARYERLRTWIEAYGTWQAEWTEETGETLPLDYFLSRLFGEVLSQAGFGLHTDFDAGRVAANLIESVQKFRWVRERARIVDTAPGKEYLEMVEDGVIAAQYVYNWQPQPEETVLLAPAYTFLMRNQPVDVQFWLDVGSGGWWERLYQPLTQPYVLSRTWPRDTVWTDADEFEARQETLHHLIQGLIRRCRRHVYLGLSELGESGQEQHGPLLHAIQRVLRQQSPAPGIR